MSTAAFSAMARTAPCIAALVLAVDAASAQPVVPEDWDCRFCAFPSGSVASFWLGSAFVSDASGKFGTYTGLDDEGFYAVADGTWRRWLDDGQVWSVRVDDLGLKSRSIALDGGRPGSYRVRAQYDAIPNIRYDGIRTPFASGTRALLPSDWVTASSTAGFATLAANERSVAISHDREQLMTGIEWRARESLDIRAEFRRDARSGNQLIAGSFAAVSAWLPAPLDYVTDEVEVAVGHDRPNAAFEVGYRGSRFSNDAPTFEWQNPFTPFTAGADFGRLALAPDNRARQLYATGSVRFGRSHVAAQLSEGSIEQDDPFVAATINPAIDAVALPRQSLNGRVDTQRLTVDVASRVSSRFRVSARVERDERDNKTQVASFTRVLTDLAVVGASLNAPYDFERSRVRADASYRLPRRMQVTVGAERDRWERNLQARQRTRETELWAEVDVRRWESLRFSARVSDSQRRGSDYSVLDRGSALQNPRLRQYHLADRDRSVAAIDLSYAPVRAVTAALHVESANDRYSRSELGLNAGDARRLTFDVAFAPDTRWNAYAAFARDDLDLRQTGSQQFGPGDWRAETDESTKSQSFGAVWRAPSERLELQLDVNATESRSQTSVLTGNPQALFPDFHTKIRGVNVSGTYTVNPRLRVRVTYRYERYANADWQLDGIDTATIPSILTVGAWIPKYAVDMLTVAFSYTPARDQ